MLIWGGTKPCNGWKCIELGLASSGSSKPENPDDRLRLLQGQPGRSNSFLQLYFVRFLSRVWPRETAHLSADPFSRKNHFGGLPLLFKTNSRYFGAFFLPNCPLDEKRYPLLELAIHDCFVPKQTLTSG